MRVQSALLSHVRSRLPQSVTIELAGDGEFGAVELMRQVADWGWRFAVRQKPNHQVKTEAGAEWQRFAALAPEPGAQRWVPDAVLTSRHQLIAHLLARWRRGEDEPWLLASNMPDAASTHRAYSRRMWIEAWFGDLKGQIWNQLT